ncbi:MAG: 30S ribosomal protein S6 [Campylobacterales bacterium]
MSKHYETMFILKPTLSEEEVKAKVEFFSEIITKGGGEIAAIEMMGVRQLAYQIEKFERGHYVVIYFTGDGSMNKELERVYGITEDVLRFIVIKYERRVEIAAWENMVNRAKGLPHKEVKLSESPRDRGEFRPRGPRGPRPDGDRGPRGPRAPRPEGERAPRSESAETKPAAE